MPPAGQEKHRRVNTRTWGPAAHGGPPHTGAGAPVSREGRLAAAAGGPRTRDAPVRLCADARPAVRGPSSVLGHSPAAVAREEARKPPSGSCSSSALPTLRESECRRTTPDLTVYRKLVNNKEEEVCCSFAPNTHSNVSLHLSADAPTISSGPTRVLGSFVPLCERRLWCLDADRTEPAECSAGSNRARLPPVTTARPPVLTCDL